MNKTSPTNEPPLLQKHSVSSSTVLFDRWENVIYSIPDKSFDFAICDIPYGIDVANMAFIKEKNTSVKQKNGNRLNPNKNKQVHEFNDWDKEVPTQEYFNQLCRISAHQIIFGVEYVNWTGLGKGRIKWNKGVAEGVSFKKYEMAYCSAIEEEIELNLLWAGMCQAKSLKEPMVQQGNKKLNEKRIHPCHKPVMLYERLYLDFGFQGMSVIDTHLGGGSNRIAAEKFGVSKFLGIEANEKHYLDQEARWRTYKSEPKLDFMYYC